MGNCEVQTCMVHCSKTMNNKQFDQKSSYIKADVIKYLKELKKSKEKVREKFEAED